MKKIKLTFEKLFFTILTIFFIFNIKFKLLPSTFIMSSVILLAMAFFYLFKNRKISNIPLAPIFWYGVLLVCSCFSVINGGLDFFIISVFLAILFNITIAPYVYFNYFRGRELEIVKYITYAGTINAVFIVGMFVSPVFRDAYLALLSDVGLLKIMGDDAVDGYYAMRLVGLTGSATYGMAFIQIVITFLYIYVVNNCDPKISIKNYLITSLLIVSAIISGRTAFIGIFVLLALVFLLYRKISQIFYFILFWTFVGVVALFFVNTLLPEDSYVFFVDWLFEIFNKGSEAGSLQENIAMYRFGLENFSAFGDFKWFGDNERTSYYMGIDVGWYRFLFAFGYVGVFAFVVFVASFINYKLFLRKNNIVLVCTIFFSFAVMFKGAILFDFYQVFFFLAVLCLISSEKYNNLFDI